MNPALVLFMVIGYFLPQVGEFSTPDDIRVTLTHCWILRWG
jgi:hypothetical protein